MLFARMGRAEPILHAWLTSDFIFASDRRSVKRNRDNEYKKILSKLQLTTNHISKLLMGNGSYNLLYRRVQSRHQFQEIRGVHGLIHGLLVAEQLAGISQQIVL